MNSDNDDGGIGSDMEDHERQIVFLCFYHKMVVDFIGDKFEYKLSII